MKKRVVQISLDIIVGDKCDGTKLAEDVATELNTRGYTVLGQGFQEDVTQYYAIEEICPHCDHINEVVWDGESKTTVCQECGKTIALCSVCEHCGDGCGNCKTGDEGK